MAEPRPQRDVKPAFKNDKRQQAVAISAVVALIALIGGAFFFRTRTKAENPIKGMQAATVAPEEPGKDPAAQLQYDQKRGIDQGQVTEDAAARYDDIVQKAKKQSDEELKRQADAQEMQRQQLLEQQKRESVSQRGTVPGSVRSDGTAGPSDGQPAAPPDPRLQVPPEVPYDLSRWTLTKGGSRIRPSYQTNAIYGSDEGYHARMEQAYFDGAEAPTTVGLLEGQNAAMVRLAQDYEKVTGPLGVRRGGQLPKGRVAVVTPKRPVQGGQYGDWLTIQAVPNGKAVVTPPKKTDAAATGGGK